MLWDTFHRYSHIIALVAVSWSIKLLLIPAYYSTDFNVHQNWLRITHQKPLSQWYYDVQSKWTLDYPPLFAYFQFLLSKIAYAFDPLIVQSINELPQTIIFQRLSVIFTDVVYLWSLLYFNNNKISFKLVLLYLWIPFIILDNIHFQYNLIMQAIFIFSVGFMQNKRYFLSALLYSTLLNFKHIYLYCAPAYFIYLLKNYIFFDEDTNKKQVVSEQPRNLKSSSASKDNWMMKLVKVGIVTLVPFVVSFGPFFLTGGVDSIKQIFSRLFPFSRGLVHQYWAPNFWAIYYFADKILTAIGIRPHQLVTYTQGTIPTVNILKVLPQVPPSITILIILALLTPILFAFCISKRSNQNEQTFVKLVSICGFIFFLFGFHVHEKAIVPYLNLLFMFAYESTLYLNAAIFVNIVNLVPLLIQPKQNLFSICVCILWIVICDHLGKSRREQLAVYQQKLINNFNFDNAKQIAKLYFEYVVQISGVMIVVYHLLIHKQLKIVKFQFLPFMMNSVWSAVFNLGWVAFLYCQFIIQLTANKKLVPI